jgi:hypothetical protein
VAWLDVAIPKNNSSATDICMIVFFIFKPIRFNIYITYIINNAICMPKINFR